MKAEYSTPSLFKRIWPAQDRPARNSRFLYRLCRFQRQSRGTRINEPSGRMAPSHGGSAALSMQFWTDPNSDTRNWHTMRKGTASGEEASCGMITEGVPIRETRH